MRCSDPSKMASHAQETMYIYHIHVLYTTYHHRLINYENLIPLLGSQVPAGAPPELLCRPGCVFPGAGNAPPNRMPISGDQIPPVFATGGGKAAFALVGCGAVRGCAGGG